MSRIRIDVPVMIGNRWLPGGIFNSVKLAPFGRTIRLARRTPWYPHYIRDIPPWA
jgi:hypothetical protein